MPLDALAPDQRAVVQLVLQQGRSYADLAGLLGISEDAVRERARAGVARLAPDDALSADERAELADYLLGQQDAAEREGTRALLATSSEAREWARAVSAQLADVAAPGTLPEIPEPEVTGAGAAAADTDAAVLGLPEEPAPEPAEEASEELEDKSPTVARPRPGRARPRPRPRATPVEAREPETEPGAAPPPRSSRLGGALLIAGLAVLLAIAVVWVFTSGDDDDPPGGGGEATPTATATPQQAQLLQEIALRAPSGGRARGTMRLFVQSNQVGFTIEATNVPASREGEAYAVWLTEPTRSSDRPRRLGFAQPVGEDGRLGTSGPREEEQARFAEILVRYRRVVVSRETTQTSRDPGPVVLTGRIPVDGGG